jgi:dTDP-4-dehydrorhamnose reductase
MTNIRAGKQVRFFSDQIRTPLFTADAARAIELAYDKEIPGGIYHLSGNEKLTRLEIGRMMKEVYGFDENLILPSTMKDAPSMAPRPKDVSLLHDKASLAFGFEPTPLKDVLNSILA